MFQFPVGKFLSSERWGRICSGEGGLQWGGTIVLGGGYNRKREDTRIFIENMFEPKIFSKTFYLLESSLGDWCVICNS